MSSARGFTLRYGSARRLDADHAAYLTHGGILVPIDVEDAPDPQDHVEVHLQPPEGRAFRFRGKAGNYIPGRGLMVEFDDAAQAEKAALDAFVTSGPFQILRSQEGLMKEAPPEVSTFEVEPPAPAEPAPTSRRGRGRRRRPRPASSTQAEAAAPAPPPDAFSEDEPTNVTEAPAPAVVASPASADGEAAEPPDDAEAPDGADFEDEDDQEEDDGLTVRAPKPGETFHIFVVKFTTVTSFLEPAAAFDETQRMTIACEPDAGTLPNRVAQLRLTLPGHNVFEMWARIDAVDADGVCLRVDENDEQYRKAVLYSTTVPARKRLEREANQTIDAPTVIQLEQEKPKEDIEKMPIRRRLARMGMDDKINMALSGNREQRMALAMDGNKAVHHYLLKNAKITLDEIAFMARLPSLNPDVLDKIAENPAYTQNPTVTKALVYNPRTPIRTAIRLLDRLPRSEVMNLAKRTTMNQRLVMAAKKKIERRGR